MSHYRLEGNDPVAPGKAYQVEATGVPSQWDFDAASVVGQEGSDFQLLDAAGAGSAPTVAETPSDLVSVYRGPEGAARVEALRQRLDASLEMWWSEGAVPSIGLLRDGLLALEAGHALDEAQRTLLLRAALLRRRGVVTALRHQPDPERTASVLQEAVTLQPPLLSPAELQRLQRTDPHSAEWGPILAHDLRVRMAIAPDEALAAEAALAALTGEEELLEAPDARVTLTGDEEVAAWSWWRMLLLLTVAVLIVLFVIWQRREGDFENVVSVPAAFSPLPGPQAQGGGGTPLPPFVIDRFEVSNAAYRRCVEDGVCPAPVSPASATRGDYFTNSDYDDYPVVNLPWQAARAYCAWAGMRLPSVAEWEAAAGFAPATQRVYRYPWGDQFESQFVVGAAAGFLDTAQLGSRSPVGDSPAGAADLAGNVAEWTETLAADGDQFVLVKGGSYLDDAEQLAVAPSQAVDQNTASPWLGFRCAASAP